jgi:DNA-directed RNA polymerase sigma subunit (sigma70/sigma32)
MMATKTCRYPSGREITLAEVAIELGISHQAAQRIEVSALRKCRAFCQRHGITAEQFLGALAAEPHNTKEQLDDY